MERADLLALGAGLRLDAHAANTVELLRGAGLPSIVLKGPAVERLLYDGVRQRDDIDLLVRPEDAATAGKVLQTAGFSLADVDRHASVWLRGDGVSVDLHTTLIGVGVSHEEAWAVLSGATQPLALDRGSVDVLSPPALALHVALHAGQHGEREGRPLDDLERALERLTPEVWKQAARLAERLDATAAFAAGLRLDPKGRELADRLGLPAGMTRAIALHAQTAPPTALGFERLGSIPGLGGKASFLARELVPRAGFMRAKYPVARYGVPGLALAYLWRPIWLARHAGPALLALGRASRKSKG
jgi:Uncharacterised nucleotidyltransferase